MPDMTIAKVAVSGILYRLDKPYDYSIPPELRDRLRPGMRVLVPFSNANRRTEAVVLALTQVSAFQKLKPVLEPLDEEPVLTEKQLKLAMWMHERFFSSVYDAVKAMLPAGLWFKDGKRRAHDKTVTTASLAIPVEEALELSEEKRARAPQQSEILRTLCAIGRASVAELREFTGAAPQSVKALVNAGVLELEETPVFRRPDKYEGDIAPLPELTAEQNAAYTGIKSRTETGEASCALLYGVTGSGKTTIYIRLIADTLESGRSAILLVPEIALTPQMINTFCSHFGDQVAILHSSLSLGERYDEWKRVRQGIARVVIGTRSAVFAPCDKLGMIIIDEEQEDTYKSENNPRYHARDVAKYRCAQDGALLLLGSATPDVESRYFADIGRYSFFTLPGRYNERALPSVSIVDMKRELRRGNGGSISELLRDELGANIAAGEQSILFLNRRGANKLVTCVECGYTYRCPRCSVGLTYHSFGNKLMCHHCGHAQRVDAVCPECGGRLSYIGVGTQKLQEELGELFPGVEVLRMDTDTVSPAGSHSLLLERFTSQRIPILIGTQMVAKGLNFENVTLVGVISADQSLYAGDYRAAERTFSLITQVVGRSGRFIKPGRAVIQTMTPDNQVIRQAATQDYESFYRGEIELRRLQNVPPYAELLAVTTSAKIETAALKCAADLRAALIRQLRSKDGVNVLGPAPLSVLKVNDHYRYRVTLSAPPGSGLRRVIAGLVTDFSADKQYRGVSIYADNNPSD